MTARRLTPTAEPPHHPGMDRRRFLLTSLAGAVVAPLAAEGQQPGKVARIGYVTDNPVTPGSDLQKAFRDELGRLGYVVGQNLVIEYSAWEGRAEQLPKMGAALASKRVDLIVVSNTDAASALIGATEGIPIVVTQGGDYVSAGLAANLARPGGRVTGLAMLWAELVPKRLELLVEAAPNLRRLLVIIVPTQDPRLLTAVHHEVSQAAKRLPVPLSVITVDGLSSLEKQIGALSAEKRVGIALTADTLWWQHRVHLSALLVKHQIPAVYDLRAFAQDGFLMS
jgi:ABC-type uncharacterized transport system substrate-binding protein